MSTLETWTAGRVARRRRRITRRASATVLAAVVAALGLLVTPLVATALEADLRTTKTAWYFDSTAGTSATRAVGGTELPDQPPPPENPSVPPDTLPAGMNNAEHQYRSAIKFDLSVVPAGAEVDGFTIVLHENSTTGTVTGLEACAFMEDFTEGGNQDMNEDLPEYSCTFSADGVQPEENDPDTEQDETALWIFEMPDTAQSWLTDDPAEGGIDNHGLVIQYVPPPNLDVGEPDPTQSSGRIFFDGPETDNPPVATIEYTVTSGEEEEESGTVDLEPADPPASDSGDTSTESGAPAESSGSSDSGGGDFGFASSPQFESEPSQSQPAPEVEQEPAPDVAEQAPAEQTQDTVAAPQPEPVAVTTPFYVWALLPIGLAALYVLSRSLTAEPQIAVEREGVMTRLIARRRAEAAGPSLNPMMQV